MNRDLDMVFTSFVPSDVYKIQDKNAYSFYKKLWLHNIKHTIGKNEKKMGQKTHLDILLFPSQKTSKEIVKKGAEMIIYSLKELGWIKQFTYEVYVDVPVNSYQIGTVLTLWQTSMKKEVVFEG